MKNCRCKRTIQHGNLLTGRKNSVKVDHTQACLNQMFQGIKEIINKHKNLNKVTE